MRDARPLAIDLFCGLGGWTEGLLAEGYDVAGFDIERHEYPERVFSEGGAQKNAGGGSWDRSRPSSWHENRSASPGGGDWFAAASPLTGRMTRYPAQLVVQDVLTLHGSQFKDAALIVASPPCQEYSYMAMPWKLAKAKAAAIRADTSGRMLADLNRLFHACFRIQAEASLAAGRHVPLVVENVRGAQPWVGRARWNFGSFYLWGDVPALMPWTGSRPAFKGGDRNLARAEGGHQWNTEFKVPSFRIDGSGLFQSASVRRTNKGNGVRFTSRDCGIEGIKGARKEASAMIAKIPLPLSRHIAAVYRA